MLEVKDLCLAYLNGYIHTKMTENLIYDKVLGSDLDTVKETAMKCMEEYISSLELSEKEKEEMKENRQQWADMALKGIKQRLYDSGKII